MALDCNLIYHALGTRPGALLLLVILLLPAACCLLTAVCCCVLLPAAAAVDADADANNFEFYQSRFLPSIKSSGKLPVPSGTRAFSYPETNKAEE